MLSQQPAHPTWGPQMLISFHFISFHFISFHFISFHFISFHFISFHFISFHFISFHFISFHFISFHFISFHFISFHSHASLDSEPRRLLVRLRGAVAWHVCVARVSAHECSALSVCAVVHVVTHSFSARGDDAHPSPSAERGDGHTPTPRVDTHPPQEGPANTHTPHSLCCPSSTNHSGRGELPRIPGLHCSAQSA